MGMASLLVSHQIRPGLKAPSVQIFFLIVIFRAHRSGIQIRTRSDLRLASVDKELDAVYETGIVRRQEQNSAGDLFRPAEASERRCRALGIEEASHLLFREVETVVSRRRYGARTYY